LNKEDILKIIDIELKDLLQNMKDQKMNIVLDESAKNFLVEKGYDEKFGARPLRRAIQRYVEDPLAEEILRGSFKEGSTIIAKHIENSDGLVFIEETPEQPIQQESKES
jgi:ATP-dependent Clp protease ATP-binding subunit ClpC